MTISAYEGWALVEQMGFRKTVGKVAEVEQYGAKMLRLDIPSFIDDGDLNLQWTTRFCGGPSIYQVTPLAEDVALDMAKQQADPRPVNPTAYRQLPAPGTPERHQVVDLEDEPF